MIPDKKSYKLYFILFYAVVVAVYLLLPTQNHSVDAWGYAAGVKYGQELFAPHHLLYNATQYVLYSLVHWIWPSVDAMALLTAVNGVFAVAGLMVLGALLKRLEVNPARRLALLAITAFSFGYWRYATENETYIIPVFFSLLGSLYYIKAMKGKGRSSALLSGLFAAIACLYHQIHFFWWIGLWGGFILQRNQSKLTWLYYLLPALLVPLGYCLVMVSYFNMPLTVSSLLHFVFHDYYAGNAGYSPEGKFLLLGGINFIRTFLQVHGSVFFLLKNYPLYWLSALVAVSALLYGLFLLFKGLRQYSIFPKNVFRVHLAIFLLQLAFAIYSVGNAEFMIMLPALLAILLACVPVLPQRMLNAMATGLFSWNFFLGVWPAHHYTWSADIKLAQWMMKHPEAHVIATEDYTIANYIYYETGDTSSRNVIKSPSYYLSRGRSLNALRTQADSILQAGGMLYTDYGGRPELMSRASMLKYPEAESFFAAYEKKEVFRLQSAVGPHIVYRLASKVQ